MKFRGKMTEAAAIKKFYNLILTVSKLSKTCVWRFSRREMFFILSEPGSGSGSDSGSGRPAVWCQMEQERFFHDYHMEGVTPQQPEIYLELEPERLARTLAALKNPHAAKSLKIKLTRKHDCPCLSFEIELVSFSSTTTTTTTSITTGNTSTSCPSSSRTCTHDVPVHLIPRSQWGDLKEPEMQPFDVSVSLPDFKQLKHLTEKYKNLGHHFTVKANREGQMRFVLDGDMINVATHFKNLELPQFGETVAFGSRFPGALHRGDGGAATEDDAFTSVRVELKRFNQFLSAEQVAPKKVIANLIEGRMIHMFLLHEDVTIQYFIPGIAEAI